MPTERSVVVRLKANPSDFNRAMATARAAVKGLRDEIDTTNDRTAWLAQGLLALGPSLIPLGAAATPILSGIVTQMTVAGTAAVTAGLAFNGVGDSLKALNEYQLEPTTANLAKMQTEFEKLGPAGVEFVRFLDRIGPKFRELQMTAREGMFPGIEDGLTEFLTIMPRIDRITGDVAEGMGKLAKEAGQGLAGPEFNEFFQYLDREAKPILLDLGRTFGNFAAGFAQMLVEFGPLTEDFSGGLLQMSRDFADWSRNLDENQTFQEFLAYVEETGPKALDFFGALVDALAAIIAAAAPVGDVMLPAFTQFLEIIADLANTPLGPVYVAAAAAISLYGRAVALASVTTGGFTSKLIANSRAVQLWQTRAKSGMHTMGLMPGAMREVAAGVGLLAASMTDLDEKMGVANATTGGFLGLMLKGVRGGVIGLTVGGLADIIESADGAAESLQAAKSAVADFQALDPDAADFNEINDALAEMRRQAQEVAASGIRGNTDFDGWADVAGITRDVANVLSFGLVDSAEDQADPWRQQIEILRQLREEWKAEEEARRDNALRLKAYHPEVLKTAEAFELAAASLTEFQDKLVSLNDLLSDRATLRAYEASLDNFRQTIRDFIKDKVPADRLFDIDFGAGRDVVGAFDQLVTDAIARSQELKEQGKDLAAVRILQRAQEDVKALIEEFPGLKAVAGEVLTELHKLASERVDIDTTPAKRRLDILIFLAGAAGSSIGDLDGSRVDIDTSSAAKKLRELQRLAGAAAAAIPGSTGPTPLDPRFPRGADGMTIPGPRWPYGDKMLILAAPGEELISNRYGQAERFREDRAAGRIPAYADGGTVSAQTDEWRRIMETRFASRAGSGPSSGSVFLSVDYDQLAAAVARHAQPLYGHVNIEAHDMNDVRRGFREDAALSGMDGVRAPRGTGL